MLNKLNRREKIVISISLFALITGLFYFNIYLSLTKQKDTLNKKLDTNEIKYNAKRNLIRNHYPQVKGDLNKLSKEHRAIIEQFPEKREISAILLEIENLARKEGVALEYFRPSEMKEEGEFYKLPIRIAFFSDYHQLVKFINILENSEEKMAVTNLETRLSNNSKKEGLLQVNLRLELYILQPR